MMQLAVNEVFEPYELSHFFRIVGYIAVSGMVLIVTAFVSAWAYNYFKKRRSLSDKVNEVMQQLAGILTQIEQLVVNLSKHEKRIAEHKDDIERRFTEQDKKLEDTKEVFLHRHINTKRKIEKYSECIKLMQEKLIKIEVEHNTNHKKI